MTEIRYFLAVCETLNFHRAAERCHVTQPALTRAVQKLEAELGGQLFCRDKGHVELTEFGRLMRPHLRDVLERRDHARTIARSFLKLEAAPLTLGVMCTIGPVLFVAFLNAFRERHPGVEVTVVENVPARLSELLLNGSLDVALMAQPEAFDPRLKVVPVYRERFGLAFPAGHPFEQRNTLHVTDVRDQTYLSRVNCEYRDYLIELCGEFGVGFHRGFRERAGRLDHDDGGGRYGYLFPAGVFGRPSRHPPSAGGQPGSRAHGIGGFGRRPRAAASRPGLHRADMQLRLAQ